MPRCNILQHTATHSDTLRHTATHFDTPRQTATTNCNTPQRHKSSVMRQTATYCNAPELHRSSVVLGTNGNQFLFRPQTRQIWRADWYNVSSIVISFVNLGFKGLGFRSIVISFVNLGFKGVGFNVRSIVLSFVNLVDFIVNVGTNLSKCRNKPQK